MLLTKAPLKFRRVLKPTILTHRTKNYFAKALRVNTLASTELRYFAAWNRKKLLNIVNKKNNNQKVSFQKQEQESVPISEKWALEEYETDAYTSKHFRVQPGEIQGFLQTNGLEFRERNNEIVL